MSTFISYSRVNSAFVVRLARDLKNAGFDVWLDQLDIPKGARWDDEIEAAVERSSTFMIVLAPESIESQNVKDELSYAIDTGKHILPVVIRPCKIPLRLRRFQYVDFTDKPYKDSLSDIKHLLSNTQRIPRAPVETPIYEKEDAVPLVTGPLIQREPPAKPEPYREFKPEGENRFRKFALPIVLGLVAMATIAVISVYANTSRRNREAPAEILPNSTPTATEEIVPTEGPTATPYPPPLQITDPRGAVPMRLVSASEFIMGSADGLPDESLEQTIHLDAFYIDTYEVTNVTYRTCVEAGACQYPKRVNSVTRVAYYTRPEFDNYPVVYVDWYMANSFCAWRGARLPTEAEWEKAARGTEGRTYPWGETASGTEANYAGAQKDTASVFEFANGMSPYGVHNMAGNVSEWTNSLFVGYPYSALDGREDPNVTGDRVIRGGSWIKADDEEKLRSYHRERADPNTAAENLGFRCVHPLDFLIPDTGGVPTATPRNGSTATSMAATSQVRKTREADGLLPSLLLTSQASAVPASSTARPLTPTLVSTHEPSGSTAESPTIEPPTPVPPTDVPPTPVPPTDVPPTDVPPTPVPPTDVPPTDPPPTDPPPTDPPPTDLPASPGE